MIEQAENSSHRAGVSQVSRIPDTSLFEWSKGRASGKPSSVYVGQKLIVWRWGERVEEKPSKQNSLL